MAAQSSPRNPRFRAFRIGAYVAYLTVVGSFSLLVINSVVRSVHEMTPRRMPPTQPLLSVQACVDQAQGLFNELDRHRKELSSHVPVADADIGWKDFRVGWLKQHREAEAHCGVDGPGRRPLREVYRRLEQAMDLYTTQSVQYAGEVGPTVDKLRAAMAAAAHPTEP